MKSDGGAFFGCGPWRVDGGKAVGRSALLAIDDDADDDDEASLWLGVIRNYAIQGMQQHCRRSVGRSSRALHHHPTTQHTGTHDGT